MFIFWDENSPQTSLMLCITIVLIVVLLLYIYKQEYNTSCDRRIMDMHYQSHIKKGDYPKLALSVHQGIHRNDVPSCKGTMLEKHKKVVEPERGVMAEHSLGDPLHKNVKKMDDPLSLDGLLQTQDETKDQQLQRSIDEDSDGIQLEGMTAPISDFEDESMSRQLVKHQEIYGEHVF